MALKTFGGMFQYHAELILRGCCHYLFLGDSQSYIGRHHTLANRYIPSMLQVRWNYQIWGAAGGPATNYGFSSSPVDSGGTVTLRGDVVTHYDSGSGTPALGAPSYKIAYAGNSTATDWGSNGAWQLMRLASDTTTGKQFPAPLLAANSYKPWYHGAHVKAANVIQGQAAGAGVLSYDIGIARRGLSLPSVAETWTTVTLSDAVNIQRTGWTSAIADAGNYSTASGIRNDHLVYVNGRTTSGYDETGKSLILLKAMVARCSSDGTITWNNTDGLNSGAGYDTIGRSGSAITDWETNYWTQAQWQDYFTATVQVPNCVTVMSIMLGHNCVQASGGVVTAAFTTSWLAVIAKLRAAYEAAFPIALYPTRKLHIMIITPWFCDTAGESNFMLSNGVGGGRSMQAAYEAICAQTADCSWFSFFNYFNETRPFDNLHAENESSGWILGQAFVDTLHRATHLKYHPAADQAASRLRGRTGRR